MDNQFEDFKVRVNQKGDVIILPQDDKYDYVLFFIHGCSQIPINLVPIFLQEPLKSAIKGFKIIIPSAKIRYVNVKNAEVRSWFNLKTYENCFGRPFDEAFSQEEVQDSYSTLKIMIEQEVQLVNNDYKKIFLSGFSQGCGMSIYTAYNLEHDVGGVIGLGGYYLLITNYNKERNIPILNVHGLKDEKRLWSEVKQSYDKFQGSDKVILCQNMEHEVFSLEPRQHFADYLIKLTRK
ncbi:phospholipase/carboxylesterase family protein (macronuclear) [Tetrahymena thermophila SB210]|uniref:Phospholipase/carboxylesterase family protein n=1 Tax=Tetrahymena thermophila (strain SB210) TaxID=312017 RepID=I7MCF5_TETTS|nr:phospholipase/carboxylesterase family protein [Tetrahymena thermophila SB210]EAR83799.1 phospholipase/carboxylesterase family protein [Tetrahymena thermophila SB210]|eukprot:XP_001031462.1 phospholipase/carboxylesterase family protein [Tetrahymena thermophila SB210]